MDLSAARRLALAAAVATTLSAAPASSEPATLTIEGRAGEGSWTAGAVSPLRGEEVVLRTAPVEGGEVRWFQVFPDLSRDYQNANYPWDPDPYQWRGFDTIGYSRVELTELHGRWEVQPLEALATPPSLRDHHDDVGSFWFQVEVHLGEQILRSPGIEDTGHRGLPPEVFRVSVRDGEGYLGYLTSFFNVPGLFGSVPWQSRNYVGVDCADVLVAARHRWKGERLTHDLNVAALVNGWPRVAEAVLTGGAPTEELRWGDDVQAGDAIAVRPEGYRGFNHIGVLYRDRGEPGVLDPADLVLHAGPGPLHVSRFAEGGFDGDVVILRP